MAKLINLVVLIGATVWLSRFPDWEPLITFAVALLTLIGLELRERRSKRHMPSKQLEHDRELFRRYDAILSERRLRDELNGNLYNVRTTRGFTGTLREFLELTQLEEGKFFDVEVQEPLGEFVAKADELSGFIVQHFFRLAGDMSGANEHSVLMLYPDLKHGSDDQRARWEQHMSAFRSLLDEVELSYQNYRQTIKKQLTI